jgi:Mg-chelatase subunit ChlD
MQRFLHRGQPALRAAALAVGLMLVALPSGSPAGAAATVDSSAAATVTQAAGYRLAATWRSAPWQLRAGHFGQAADVASSPAGDKLYMLDSRNLAVHVLAPDGTPRAVWPLPDPGSLPGVGWAWIVRRMDGAPDGSLLVLWAATYQRYVVRSRLERVSATGARLAVMEAGGDYNDVGVGPDGRIYLTHPYPLDPEADGPGGVDVFDVGLRRVAALGVGVLTMPTGVDVRGDGVVFVINRVPSPSGAVPPPATPLPSGVQGHFAVPAAMAPEGVAQFAASHEYLRTEAFLAPEDVGVGPAGAFVSRTGEVFALGERSPLYSAPAGNFTSVWLGGSTFRLHVPASGGLAASMNHCYHQGLALFSEVARRPGQPSFSGELDRPALEGPVHPLRVAAGDGLALLQGRFTILGSRPEVSYHIGPQPVEPQSIQRWTAGGALSDELGVCASAHAGRDVADVWWVRDIAAAGADIFTVDPELVHRRSGSGFPAWAYWPGQLADDGEVSQLAAVAADAGRVAVLDVGTRQMVVLDEGGTLVHRWSTEALGPAVVPVDIAMTADTVYVADAGGARVFVHALDGTPRGSWPLPDGPRSIASDQGGDVYVLGQTGWAYRFQSDGTPVAAWPMPDRTRSAMDLTVDDQGRVLIPFEDRLGTHDSLGFPTARLLDAGIWVFEPTPTMVPPVVTPGGCVAVPDKVAAPSSIPLGADVTVQLSVHGSCPGKWQRGQAMIVFDTSRSMSWNEALARAQSAVMTLLGQLDARAVEAGLVTFDDDGTLDVPLTADLAGVRARVAALTAIGDTRPGPGIDAAVTELTGPRGKAAGAQAIYLVTDGDLQDLPLESARRAAAAGITLYALAFPSGSFTDYDAALLAQLIGDPTRRRLFIEPDAASLAALVQTDGLFEPQPGLFASVVVDDVIPANMRLQPGSSVPPAVETDQHLRWTLPAVSAADGLTLTYRLTPLEIGTWPTNVRAGAAYRDAVGVDGILEFPVPRVHVWERGSLDRHVYLPYLGAAACFRDRVPLDVVLVVDTSDSMGEPDGQGATKLAAAQSAAAQFVTLLQLARDRVGVVAFNSGSHVATTLTSDPQRIQQALFGLSLAPGTRIDTGLAAAGTVLASGTRADARRVVVLLTDGLQNGSPDPVKQEAARLRGTGAQLFAIGLGPAVDADLLREVAADSGAYYPSPSAADLAAIYRTISAALTCARN